MAQLFQKDFGCKSVGTVETRARADWTGRFARLDVGKKNDRLIVLARL